MLSEIGNPALQWLNANPHWSGLITFLISAGESIAIIGTVVPGSIMMTAVGTLAGAGIIPLWPTIFWAILGAIVGDGVSYWLGYYFKDRLHNMWPFSTRPEMLRSGESFFKKYGGMSVFIGRFVGPVRALVPVVAGMFGVTPLRFTIANVLSAIGWAPAYMLPGILLGAASLELPPDITTHLVVTLLLIGLFIILCIGIIRKLLLLIHNQINEFLNWIWRWLTGSRYFHTVTFILKHHNPAKTHGQLIPAFYFIIALALFLSLGMYVKVANPNDILIDKIFFSFFRSIRTPLFDNIMLAMTLLGEKILILSLAAGMFVWLAYKKHWHTAWHVLILVILTLVSTHVTKNWIHSPRPWGIEQSPAGFSFPSGHSVLSATFYFGLALLLISVWRLKRLWPLLILAGFITVLVGISRVYLGAHWTTDVVGGWLLAIVLLNFITLSYNRKSEPKKIESGKMLLILSIIFIPVYSFLAYSHYKDLGNQYKQIHWPTDTLSINAWWEHEKQAPEYRLNRFGLEQDILNLQWVGTLEQIHQILLDNHWEAPEDSDWISAVQRIADINSSEHLPLVSPIHLDKKPTLVMINHTTNGANGNNKKLIVLRLWESNIKLENTNLPLWVGSVDIIPRTYSWLFKKTKARKITLTPDIIFSQLPRSLDIKEMSITTKFGKQHTIILIKPKNMRTHYSQEAEHYLAVVRDFIGHASESWHPGMSSRSRTRSGIDRGIQKNVT